MSQQQYSYEHDGAEIYRQSFATIRAEADLRRLGRSLQERGDSAAAVVQRWRTQQREVRRLHERLFYRPLLAAVARRRAPVGSPLRVQL